MDGRKFSMKKPGLSSVQCGKPAARTRSWIALLAPRVGSIDAQRPSAQPGASVCWPAPVTDVCTNCGTPAAFAPSTRLTPWATSPSKSKPSAVHGGHLHGEDGAGALGGPDHGVAVVKIAGDQLGAERLDGLGPVGGRVAHQGADGNARREQGAGGGAALPAGGAGDQDGCGICGHGAPRVLTAS